MKSYVGDDNFLKTGFDNIKDENPYIAEKPDEKEIEA